MALNPEEFYRHVIAAADSERRLPPARMTGVGVPLVLMLYPRDHHDLADLPDELAANSAC